MSSESWTPNEEQQEIIRLLNIVTEQTNGDVYLGKRGTTRFSTPTRLEATHDPSNPAEIFPVTLHNLCEKGVAFLSRRPFSQKDDLYIREFSSHRPNDWVGVRVTHCTGTFRGFIVGAKLHWPIDERNWTPTREDSESGADAETVVDSTPRPRGLWARLGFKRASG